MALNASIDLELQSGGTKVHATDSTVYGDGATNPSRAQSLVNWTLVRKPTTGDENISFNYNETSDTEILVDISKDGWYRLTMTITKESGGGWPGADYSYQKIIDFLVIDRLCACITEYGKDIFLDKKCGCECEGQLVEYYCIYGQVFCGLPELARRNDMPSAQMGIERLEQECALLSDCGC